MAFDISGIIGSGTQFAASYVEGYPDPAYFTSDAGGSYTLKSSALQGSLEDSNTGFPNVLSPNNLGLPGSPAFVNGDIPGVLVSTYTGPKPISPFEVTEAFDDYTGTPNKAGEIGGVVVAYSPGGFLVETLNGFDSAFGGGTLSGMYAFYSTTTSLNTLDASAKPITPATAFPINLIPASGSAAVPEPSMGLAVGLAFLAVMALRAVRRGAI